MELMKLNSGPIKSLLATTLFALFQMTAHASPQVLATVGKMEITSDDLNMAIDSSPFNTQFVSMDENDQAGIRGDMLKRLVASRLFLLEAQRLGLDKSPGFEQDIDNFRLGLLYRQYTDELRKQIVIPPDALSAMKTKYKGDADGLDAAKSSYIYGRYKVLEHTTIQNLIKQGNVVLHLDRIKAGLTPDTVLMNGKGFEVKYSDITGPDGFKKTPNTEWIKTQLYKRGELLLAAQYEEKKGVDVSAKVQRYQKERLPALLLESKTREWIPDEDTLHRWFDKHPEVASVPERRHVGELVVATRKEAEELRGRILKGESLFVLAGKYSIDPQGRKHSGDMGWITDGLGDPELDSTLGKLTTDQVSDVVQTKAGFCLLTIMDRQASRKLSYEAVRDRVAQLVINEKMPPYIQELEGKYKVTWNVLQPQGPAQGR